MCTKPERFCAITVGAYVEKSLNFVIQLIANANGKPSNSLFFSPFTNNSSLTDDNDVKFTFIYYSNPNVSGQKKISAWCHVLFT